MEKKKFVKPSMKVIELKSKVGILQASGGCGCDGDYCSPVCLSEQECPIECWMTA